MKAAADVSLRKLREKLAELSKIKHYDPMLTHNFCEFCTNTLTSFQNDVADLHNLGDWERSLSAERLRELRGLFDSELDDLRKRMDALHADASNLLEDAAGRALEALDRLPDLQHYEPMLEKKLSGNIDAALSNLKREVSGCMERGQWERSLCTERCGELERRFSTTSLDLLHRNELLRKLRRQRQIFPLVAFAVAAVAAGSAMS